MEYVLKTKLTVQQDAKFVLIQMHAWFANQDILD
jgi:hypothetical protein